MIPNYRIYSEPCDGIMWVAMHQSYIDNTHRTYGPGWTILSYKAGEYVDDINGYPVEKYVYEKRTKTESGILQALDEAAHGLWNTEPLPNPFEMIGYGDGDAWVLVTMYPQYYGNGKIDGWLTRYHPNSLEDFQNELAELGVDVPTELTSKLGGETLMDLTHQVQVPCIKDFPELQTVEACAEHALEALDKSYWNGNPPLCRGL